MLILYGSQTGAAKGIAEVLYAAAVSRGVSATLAPANDHAKVGFLTAPLIVVVCATTGDGDAPSNAEEFLRFVRRRAHARDLLAHARVAVLGLGDTNYDKFCGAAKTIAKRLAELGAAPVIAAGYADEAVGLDMAVEPWMACLWRALEASGEVGTVGSGVTSAAPPALPPPIVAAAAAPPPPLATSAAAGAAAAAAAAGEVGAASPFDGAGVVVGGSPMAMLKRMQAVQAERLQRRSLEKGSAAAIAASAAAVAAAAVVAVTAAVPASAPVAAKLSSDTSGGVCALGVTTGITTHAIDVQDRARRRLKGGSFDGVSRADDEDEGECSASAAAPYTPLIIDSVTIDTRGMSNDDVLEAAAQAASRASGKASAAHMLPHKVLTLPSIASPTPATAAPTAPPSIMAPSISAPVVATSVSSVASAAAAASACHVRSLLHLMPHLVFDPLSGGPVDLPAGKERVPLASVSAGAKLFPRSPVVTLSVRSVSPEEAAAADAAAAATAAAAGSMVGDGGILATALASSSSSGPSALLLERSSNSSISSSGSRAPSPGGTGSGIIVRPSGTGTPTRSGASGLASPTPTSAAAIAATAATMSLSAGGVGGASGLLGRCIEQPVLVPLSHAQYLTTRSDGSSLPPCPSVRRVLEVNIDVSTCPALRGAWTPGDAIGIIAPNEAHVVATICARMRMDPSTRIDIRTAGSGPPLMTPPITAAVAGGSGHVGTPTPPSASSTLPPPPPPPPPHSLRLHGITTTTDESHQSSSEAQGVMPPQHQSACSPTHATERSTPAPAAAPAAVRALASTQEVIASSSSSGGSGGGGGGDGSKSSGSSQSPPASPHVGPMPLRIPTTTPLLSHTLHAGHISSPSSTPMSFSPSPSASASVAAAASAQRAMYLPAWLPGFPFPTLFDVLSWCVDLTSPPKKALLRLLGDACVADAADSSSSSSSTAALAAARDRDLLYLLAGRSPCGVTAFSLFLEAQRCHVADLLSLFPTSHPSLPSLLSTLPPLPPRFYSLCSSPLATPHTMRIAFNVVQYEVQQQQHAHMRTRTTMMTTPGTAAADAYAPPVAEGKAIVRNGLATTWLEALALTLPPPPACLPAAVSSPSLSTGAHGSILTLSPPLSPSSSSSSSRPHIRVFLRPARTFFPPPSVSTPMVLIGPGTGVSPFLGFLQHRAAKLAAHERLATTVCSGTWRRGARISCLREEPEHHTPLVGGPVALFFGNRAHDTDFLFRDELRMYRATPGVLSALHVAWSRCPCGAPRTYVQDLLKGGSTAPTTPSPPHCVMCGEMSGDGPLGWGRSLAELLLCRGAHLYVCGSGAMAGDVRATVTSILREHGPGVVAEHVGGAGVAAPFVAEEVVAQLLAAGRYSEDKWG